jgi:hypothetical protein
MPLVKGPAARTRKGVSKNIKIESATKPHAQAVAIALSMKDRSVKKSKKIKSKSDGY